MFLHQYEHPQAWFLFFLDERGFAVCSLQKMESLNSSLEGKSWHNETNQKKNGKAKFLGEKTIFPPPSSCSSISVRCGHHTPDSLHFTLLAEMNSWEELRDVPPPCSAFGEGSGGGGAWLGSTAENNFTCVPWPVSPAVPHLSHRLGVTWFSFHWATANQYGYKEI